MIIPSRNLSIFTFITLPILFLMRTPWLDDPYSILCSCWICSGLGKLVSTEISVTNLTQEKDKGHDRHRVFFMLQNDEILYEAILWGGIDRDAEFFHWSYR